MKVRIIRTLALGDRSALPGEVIDLPTACAEGHIVSGNVSAFVEESEVVEAPKSEAIEPEIKPVAEMPAVEAPVAQTADKKRGGFNRKK